MFTNGSVIIENNNLAKMQHLCNLACSSQMDLDIDSYCKCETKKRDETAMIHDGNFNFGKLETYFYILYTLIWALLLGMQLQTIHL
jgi:hypothetical protein